MNLTPTSNTHIFETQWFVVPSQPLMEYKYYYAKVGEIIWVRTARRGVTMESIKPALDKVESVISDSTEEYADNSIECFKELENALTKQS